MSKTQHIIIAEPSTIVRLGLASILQQSPQLSVNIIEVSDIASLSTAALRTTPDLLIINPIYIGVTLPPQLRASLGNENLKIVALQTIFSEASALKEYDAAISIIDGEGSIIETILKVTQRDVEQEERRDLSQREKEIIICVVRGMTNKQIADSLCLSTHTVIAHRRNIASKLQIHSPSGLTIYAIVNKLVDLSDIKNSISQSRDEE